MKFRSSIVASVIGMIPLFISAQGNQTDSTIFDKVEIEASFPGGEQAWRRYLEKTLASFNPGDHGAPAGSYTVYVQFIVDKAGNITEVTALTNYGHGMEEKVVEIIKKGPKWMPAIQDGRNVKAYRKQPVTFLVMDDAFDIQTRLPYALYAGMDNRVTITAKKVKQEDLDVTVSEGKISGSEGNYIIKVDKPGRVIIEIYSRKNKKKIGTANLEVKEKPKT